MNRTITMAVLLLVIALVTGITTSTILPQTFADPKEPNGKCFGHEKGAFGCAGNIGGFIETPKDRCIEQNTPFSEFHGSCHD